MKTFNEWLLEHANGIVINNQGPSQQGWTISFWEVGAEQTPQNLKQTIVKSAEALPTSSNPNLSAAKIQDAQGNTYIASAKPIIIGTLVKQVGQAGGNQQQVPGQAVKSGKTRNAPRIDWGSATGS